MQSTLLTAKDIDRAHLKNFCMNILKSILFDY